MRSCYHGSHDDSNNNNNKDKKIPIQWEKKFKLKKFTNFYTVFDNNDIIIKQILMQV